MKKLLVIALLSASLFGQGLINTPVTVASPTMTVAFTCQSANSLGFLLNGTDETAKLNSVLAAFYTAGGGCLAIDANKTLRADSKITIPNNAASITLPFSTTGNSGYFIQPNIRITGANQNAFYGNGVTGTGSTLDLRFTGSGGKLVSLAQGNLEIDHITVMSGGASTDCNSLIVITGTTTRIHNNIFAGTNTSSPCTTAITSGGTNQPNSNIQGNESDWAWGTVYIYENTFGASMGTGSAPNIQHAFIGNSSVNDGLFNDNALGGVANIGSNQTADKSVILMNGYGTGSNASRAMHFERNLIEAGTTPVGMYLANTERAVISIECWDGTSANSCIDGTSTATKNSILPTNFVDQTGGAFIGPNLSTNNYFPWNSIPFVFDGNGSALSGTITHCSDPTPFGGYVNQFAMIADQSGNATITVKTVAQASYTGPGSATDISNGGESMSAATSKVDTTLTGWSRTITPGTVFCVVLSSPATVTRVSGSVQVWTGK